MLVWLQSILTKRRILLFQFLSISLIIHTIFITTTVILNRKASIKFSVFKNINTDIPVIFDHLKKTGINKNFEGQIRRSYPKRSTASKPAKKAATPNTSPVRTLRPAPSLRLRLRRTPQGERTLQSSSATKQAKAIDKATRSKVAQAVTKTTSMLSRTPKFNPKLSKDTAPSKVEATKPKEPEIQEMQTKNPELEKPIVPETDTKLSEEILDKINGLAYTNQIAGQITGQELVLGRQDIEFFNSYMQIQGQVNSIWTPPAGFNDHTCELKASINSSGLLEKILIEKSSGAPAFDISAKLALRKIEWPKLCWNKEIIITFRQ